jgi:hypothetical protein
METFRTIGIDLGITSAHTAVVVDPAGAVLARRQVRPTLGGRRRSRGRPLKECSRHKRRHAHEEVTREATFPKRQLRPQPRHHQGGLSPPLDKRVVNRVTHLHWQCGTAALESPGIYRRPPGAGRPCTATTPAGSRPAFVHCVPPCPSEPSRPGARHVDRLGFARLDSSATRAAGGATEEPTPRLTRGVDVSVDIRVDNERGPPPYDGLAGVRHSFV